MIYYFGSGNFALQPLSTLISDTSEVSQVVTMPPRPKGRKMKISPNVVEELAVENSIPVTHFEGDWSYLLSLPRPDFIVVVSFGAIIPQEVLDFARVASINLHPSSLPKFRGAAPIERSIEAGLDDLDICVIKMSKKLDAGDILSSKKYVLNSVYASEVYADISLQGGILLAETIRNFHSITPVPQSGTPTYAHKITKSELKITPDEASKYTAEELLRKVRAFDGCGFITVEYDFGSVKFIRAKILTQPITRLDILCKCGKYLSPEIIRESGKGNFSPLEKYKI